MIRQPDKQSMSTIALEYVVNNEDYIKRLIKEFIKDWEFEHKEVATRVALTPTSFFYDEVEDYSIFFDTKTQEVVIENKYMQLNRPVGYLKVRIPSKKKDVIPATHKFSAFTGFDDIWEDDDTVENLFKQNPVDIDRDIDQAYIDFRDNLIDLSKAVLSGKADLDFFSHFQLPIDEITDEKKLILGKIQNMVIVNSGTNFLFVGAERIPDLITEAFEYIKFTTDPMEALARRLIQKRINQEPLLSNPNFDNTREVVNHYFETTKGKE